MDDTKIASKAKAQLANFMGKVFTHFSKPTRRFIEKCIYGIQASGDTKLSSIVRAIDDYIRPTYTEKKGSAAISTTINLKGQAPRKLQFYALFVQFIKVFRFFLIPPTAN